MMNRALIAAMGLMMASAAVAASPTQCLPRAPQEETQTYVGRLHDYCEVRWNELQAAKRTGHRTHGLRTVALMRRPGGLLCALRPARRPHVPSPGRDVPMRRRRPARTFFGGAEIERRARHRAHARAHEALRSQHECEEADETCKGHQEEDHCEERARQGARGESPQARRRQDEARQEVREER